MNRAAAAFALVLVAWPPVAHAELTVVIREGVTNAIPIAVEPFGWSGEGELPFDVAQVVADDLARSGRFAPMAREDMVEKPTAGAVIDFADWRMLGTEVIVVGTLNAAGPQGYEVDFQLFDTVRGERMISYNVPAPATALRAAAHKVSDLVYEALTGERGAFSTRIAYVSVEDETYELIVADADGANQQVIVRAQEPIMSPAWSPDGTRLAYVAFEHEGSAVWVQELVTAERRKVSSRPGVNGAPAWSPDGKQLALALSDHWGNVDVHVIDLHSDQLRRLTNHPAIDTEPAWSGDGEAIFFTSDRAGGPQVYRVEVSGGAPRRVTFEGRYNARPRIAPGDHKLAVVHNDRGRYRIALVDLASGATQVLTEGRLDESPSFAPNGSMIIYATEDGGSGVLAAVSTDGRIHQRLASRDGDVREPAWSPFATP